MQPRQPRQQRAQRREQGREGGVQDRAFQQVHDLGRALAVQAEQHAAAAAPGRQVHPPAPAGGVRASAAGVARVAGTPQGGFEQAGFPGGVTGTIPVLQRAAAAGAEMPAGRRRPRGAGHQDHRRLTGPAFAASEERLGPDGSPGRTPGR